MPYKSPWSISIPSTDLPTFIFESPTAALSTKPMYIDAGKPESHYLSLSTYRLWSKRFAAGLLSTGFEPGDRILLFAENSIFYPVVIMGTIMAGGIFTGAAPSSSTAELVHEVRDADPRILLADSSGLTTPLAAADITGMSNDRVFLFADAPLDGRATDTRVSQHWHDLIASPEVGEEYDWRKFASREESNRTAAIVYSSGTSGIAKGIEVTHYNYIALCTQFSHRLSLNPGVVKIMKETRSLCILGMYRIHAQSVFAMILPHGNWGVAYIMPKYDLVPMLRNIKRFQITNLNVLPFHLMDIPRNPLVRDGKVDLNSVKSLGSGGAPGSKMLYRNVRLLWKEKFPFHQTWGMTETTGGILSSSHLNANSEAKIIDFDGVEELSRGQIGELWVRGPTITKGYWRNPEATRKIFVADEWLKTGDVARLDEDDVIQDIMEMKGERVAPAEPENLLLEHDGIVDTGVIGISTNDGDRPRAYIVKEEGRNITAAEIEDFMAKRAPEPKRITGGIMFLNKISRKDDGKILRRLLRERANIDSQHLKVK